MEAETGFLPEGTVTSARGFVAGATSAGIKTDNSLDLGILFSEAPCVTAGVFTTTRIKAAPVILCRDNLPGETIRAVVANSGCANAGTGEQGLCDAVAMATEAADHVGVPLGDVLVASTGIIGKMLPLWPIKAGIKKINLTAGGGHALAKAIMTTDTVPKEVALRGADSDFIIGGVAKGSGMIHPQMGTLLCFLATDARVDKNFLARGLAQAVDSSFNMVSIDGDTSPNDTVILMANGLAGNETVRQDTKPAAAFQQALNRVCIYLAKAIARDGEGASRLIEVNVQGASSVAGARLAARTVVASPLVKAAVHGGDPNWGRILAAVGRSGAEVKESKLDISIGGIQMAAGGSALPFNKKEVAAVFGRGEVAIDINLNLADAAATAWGCDLSPEYVTINSQYTT